MWNLITGILCQKAERKSPHGDDQINDADLTVWESQYGSAPPLAAIATVPEPTTSALALAALCLAISSRQFRR